MTMQTLTDSHLYILRHVPTSYAWNWRTDRVEDLERWGLVKIEHGRARWSLTDAGRAALANGEKLDQP